jgi:hypothetical protein
MVIFAQLLSKQSKDEYKEFVEHNYKEKVTEYYDAIQEKIKQDDS